MVQLAIVPPASEIAQQPTAEGFESRSAFLRMDDLWIVLGSSLYLSLKLFMLSGAPVLLAGDQLFFWMDAQRLLHGDRIYRDFFQFTGPGTDLIYLAAFRLFGQRIWIPNVIVLILGVVLCWISFRIARLIGSRSLAFLSASLFVVVIYGRLLNGTHHWFSELAVLAALATLMQGMSGRRVALAGSLLGLATFFTQTRGPCAAVAVAAYFLWVRARTQSSWRECYCRIALMAGSLIVTWLALSSYFIATLGWHEIWNWQVVYVARYQVRDRHSLGLPYALTWKNLLSNIPSLLVYLSLPVSYGSSLWRAWRNRRWTLTQNEASRVLLTLTGVFTALEVAQSPNWLRVYCVAAPGILLSVGLIGQFQRYQRPAMGLMWTIVFCTAFHQIWTQYRHQSVPVRTPAGTVSTTSLQAEKLDWIAQRTRPGDFFFQAAWPGVYLPLQLRNPVFAEAFYSAEVTRPEFVTQGIEQLEARQVEYILWAPTLDSPENPANAAADHLGPFRDFLHERYRKAWTFSDENEIWQRK